MKKLLTTVVTAATVVMMAFASVFAAGSATELAGVLTATDGNGNAINTVCAPSDVPLISPEIAASITGDNAADLTVLWQKNITATSLPATLTFGANGTDGNTLYVFHYNGSAWELVATGVGPTVTATFTSLSPVAIVRKATGAGAAPVAPVAPAADATTPVADPATTSPATGSSVLVMAISTLAVAGSAAFVVATKKEV
ncbi:MAG: hypothetical protein MJ094_05160 [Saccharofermentans sp.]|nr:hypothetical protein [Saccharofermentans sp.]